MAGWEARKGMSGNDSVSQGKVDFADRLPQRSDADTAGFVDAFDDNGYVRAVLWDWIPPNNRHAAELWRINGFKSWGKRS